MIRRLTIKNYALIDELELKPDSGLNVMTGETGAGKSIMLGAFELALGSRADFQVLRDKSKKCVVEAEYALKDESLKDYFAAKDIDYFANQLIVRREILPAGRSRAFVNDCPVTLDILTDIGKQTVDLHRQFATLDLHQRSFQERMLDSYAASFDLLDSYTALYANWYQLVDELTEAKAREAEARKEEDFFRFQYEELHAVELEEGEEEKLEQQLKQLEHAEEIKQQLGGAAEALTEGERTLTEKLREVEQMIEQVRDYHSEVPPLLERLDSVNIELEDISAALSEIAEDESLDPGELESIRKKHDKLQSFLFKHKMETVEELLQYKEELRQKLEETEQWAEEIDKLNEQIATVEKEMHELAKKLSNKRKAAVPFFEKEVLQLLSNLSMPKATFVIQIESTDRFTPTGRDRIEFLFSANPGSQPGRIKDIASGGEMSRLALCIKSLVAGKTALPTMIFDEIDSGVSGDVAQKMGRILAQMSADHQILVITHTPQIAALGNKHYFVYKEEVKGSTFTRLDVLKETERVEKIAAMLSSDPPTKAAIDNAKELMSLKN